MKWLGSSVTPNPGTLRQSEAVVSASCVMRPAVVFTPTTTPIPEAIATIFRSRSISPLKGVPSSEASTTMVTTASDLASRQLAVKRS